MTPHRHNEYYQPAQEHELVRGYHRRCIDGKTVPNRGICRPKYVRQSIYNDTQKQAEYLKTRTALTSGRYGDVNPKYADISLSPEENFQAYKNAPQQMRPYWVNQAVYDNGGRIENHNGKYIAYDRNGNVINGYSPRDIQSAQEYNNVVNGNGVIQNGGHTFGANQKTGEPEYDGKPLPPEWAKWQGTGTGRVLSQFGSSNGNGISQLTAEIIKSGGMLPLMAFVIFGLFKGGKLRTTAWSILGVMFLGPSAERFLKNMGLWQYAWQAKEGAVGASGWLGDKVGTWWNTDKVSEMLDGLKGKVKKGEKLTDEEKKKADDLEKALTEQYDKETDAEKRLEIKTKKTEIELLKKENAELEKKKDEKPADNNTPNGANEAAVGATGGAIGAGNSTEKPNETEEEKKKREEAEKELKEFNEKIDKTLQTSNSKVEKYIKGNETKNRTHNQIVGDIKGIKIEADFGDKEVEELKKQLLEKVNYSSLTDEQKKQVDEKLEFLDSVKNIKSEADKLNTMFNDEADKIQQATSLPIKFSIGDSDFEVSGENLDEAKRNALFVVYALKMNVKDLLETKTLFGFLIDWGNFLGIDDMIVGGPVAGLLGHSIENLGGGNVGLYGSMITSAVLLMVLKHYFPTNSAIKIASFGNLPIGNLSRVPKVGKMGNQFIDSFTLRSGQIRNPFNRKEILEIRDVEELIRNHKNNDGILADKEYNAMTKEAQISQALEILEHYQNKYSANAEIKTELDKLKTPEILLDKTGFINKLGKIVFKHERSFYEYGTEWTQKQKEKHIMDDINKDKAKYKADFNPTWSVKNLGTETIRLSEKKAEITAELQKTGMLNPADMEAYFKFVEDTFKGEIPKVLNDFVVDKLRFGEIATLTSVSFIAPNITINYIDKTGAAQTFIGILDDLKDFGKATNERIIKKLQDVSVDNKIKKGIIEKTEGLFDTATSTEKTAFETETKRIVGEIIDAEIARIAGVLTIEQLKEIRQTFTEVERFAEPARKTTFNTTFTNYLTANITTLGITNIETAFPGENKAITNRVAEDATMRLTALGTGGGGTIRLNDLVNLQKEIEKMRGKADNTKFTDFYTEFETNFTDLDTLYDSKTFDERLKFYEGINTRIDCEKLSESFRGNIVNKVNIALKEKFKATESGISPTEKREREKKIEKERERLTRKIRVI